MGASNFCKNNTSKVFAVLMDREGTFKECSVCGEIHKDYDYNLETLLNCDSCESEDLELKSEYVSPEEYEYDDLKEYIRDLAEEKVKILPYRYSEENGSGNDNQYNANELFSYSVSKYFGDIEVNIKIVGQIVGAYYEGASLDFEVSIYDGEDIELSDGYYKVTVDSVIEGLFEVGYQGHYTSKMNRGMRLIQSNNATKWAEKEVEKLKDLVEEVFTQISEPLNVVGTFSNGETIYSKAV